MSNPETRPMSPGMSKSRPDGWWYPYIFVGFMGVVFIVNGIMITLAVTTFSGLETEDHYRKGVSYNANLDQVKAQDALGWSYAVEFPVEMTGPDLRGGPFRLTMSDKAGNPLTGLDIRVFFVRPTVKGYDQKLPLVEKGNGVYETSVALTLPGLWDVRILAERGGDRYQKIHRIEVP